MRVSVWDKAAASTLVPALPGRWRIIPWVVYAEPVGWFTRAVIFSVSYHRISAAGLVQFLAQPWKTWNGSVKVDLGGYGKHWPEPANLAQATDMMREVADLALAEAIPFFHTQATLDGRLAYLHKRVADVAEHFESDGWQDVNVDEELTYVHILRGDLAAAEQAAGWAQQAADIETRQWAFDANDRVQRVIAAARRSPDEAIALLRAQAGWTRGALKIHPPDDEIRQ